jgi:hypothetical protein
VYLRVTRGRFDPDCYDEGVAVSQEIADAIACLPGLARYQGAGDRASGAIVAVSTWNTEAHARFDRSGGGDCVGWNLGVDM